MRSVPAAFLVVTTDATVLTGFVVAPTAGDPVFRPPYGRRHQLL
jgi:hypothetical protein